MKKIQFLIKVIFSRINVYQLQSNGIINYSEAINKDTICHNILMFSNNTKCNKRNFRTKELA